MATLALQTRKKNQETSENSFIGYSMIAFALFHTFKWIQGEFKGQNRDERFIANPTKVIKIDGNV